MMIMVQKKDIIKFGPNCRCIKEISNFNIQWTPMTWQHFYQTKYATKPISVNSSNQMQDNGSTVQQKTRYLLMYFILI